MYDLSPTHASRAVNPVCETRSVKPISLLSVVGKGQEGSGTEGGRGASKHDTKSYEPSALLSVLLLYSCTCLLLRSMSMKFGRVSSGLR